MVSKPGIRRLHNYPISETFSFSSPPSSQSSVFMKLAHTLVLAFLCSHTPWSASVCPLASWFWPSCSAHSLVRVCLPTSLHVWGAELWLHPWISDTPGGAWPWADLLCLLSSSSLIQLKAVVPLFSVRLCNLIKGLQLVSGRVWGSKLGLGLVHQLRWGCEGSQSHLCVRRPQMSSSGKVS